MPKQRHAGAKKISGAMIFMNLTAGKWVSQAIAVTAELGIADLLKKGTKTAAQIARLASASEALGSLLRPETGHFASLGSESYFAPTRHKHSGPMHDS